MFAMMLTAKAQDDVSVSGSSSVRKSGSDNDDKAGIDPSEGLMCSIAESSTSCTGGTVAMATSGACRVGTHVVLGPQQPDDADMGVCSRGSDISVDLALDVGCTSVAIDASRGLIADKGASRVVEAEFIGVGNILATFPSCDVVSRISKSAVFAGDMGTPHFELDPPPQQATIGDDSADDDGAGLDIFLCNGGSGIC